MSSAHTPGDLATQLVTESRRSILTITLLKYNDTLVRSLIREQRDLEKAASPYTHSATPPPALLIIQTIIAQNKRCLLAYHSQRLDHLITMYWSGGCSLPHVLQSDTRARMSPHEVDFLKEYHGSVMEFRGEFEMDIDVTSGIESPPRELNVLVRVVRECGEIQTEGGVVDFKMGQRYQVRRTDIEHLIVQGYLEEV